MRIAPEQVTSEPTEERQLDPLYENHIRYYQEQMKRALTGKVVIRGDEEPWVQNRNSYVKYYLHALKGDTACSHMTVFTHKINTHNGMHRHQGGLVIFALEGPGYTIYDGARLEWQSDDLILLPIKPGGVDHQHFNSSVGKPAMWLALITIGFKPYLANEMVQISNSPEWSDTLSSDLVQIEPRDLEELRKDVGGITPTGGWGDTYMDQLFKARDEYRQQTAGGASVVVGADLQWENNRQGRMKWYMHPAMRNVSLRSQMVFLQEIQPGSRSGRQVHPGGLVHYILEGEGYTIINGSRHEWKKGDVIAFPFLPAGVDYQHFNSDPQRVVRFIASIPNFYDALGMDLGSRLEQIENAPEWVGR
jgi:quercetin dioxygenase-like cupin family protein